MAQEIKASLSNSTSAQKARLLWIRSAAKVVDALVFKLTLQTKPLNLFASCSTPRCLTRKRILASAG